ncbi:MAG TPA: hypothetical protein VF810_00290 [Patescibacteria group bacterium]
MKKTNKFIIAGPCSTESLKLIQDSIKLAKKRKIDFLRVNLWKPRTKPGFDGMGEKGLPILVETIKQGINPGLEVIMPEQAKQVLDTVLPILGNGKLLLWIGSRNQNHLIQQEIAKIAASDRRVYLLVKNQPWKNETHWEGIVEHVLAGGIATDRLILCDRGFSPEGKNPFAYRNIPDFAMAMRIKNKFNLPMVFDPSHSGGSRINVFHVTEKAKEYNYDGLLTEVHPTPEKALTDAKQQVTWDEFDQLVKIMNYA